MGTHQVIFTLRAREDLRTIATYVAQKSSSEIAERLGSALIDKALTLSNLLERGRVLPELKKPDVREIFLKRIESFIGYGAIAWRLSASGMRPAELPKSIATNSDRYDNASPK